MARQWWALGDRWVLDDGSAPVAGEGVLQPLFLCQQNLSSKP